MVSVDRNTLISQIVSLNPQLKPDELRKLSDAQLQTKLSQTLAGDNDDKNIDSLKINANSSETPKALEISEEEAQDAAIENIESNAQQAQRLLDAQDDGNISKAYNFVKEKLNSELAKSNVAKVVHKQFETAEFLREAKQGTLTVKDYINRKRESLLNSILGFNNYNDKQKALIKTMIEALSPKELDTMQTKILSLPDISSNEFNEASKNIIFDLREFAILKPYNDNVLHNSSLSNNKKVDVSTNKTSNVKIKVKPAFKMEDTEANRLMSFEETYLLEQGVEFNKENIQNYNNSVAQYTFANSLTNKRNEIHNLLTSAIEKAKVQGSTGLSSVDLINTELISSIGAAITKLYGKDNLAKGLKDLTNGQYTLNDEIKSLEDLSRKDLSAMNNIAKLILTKVDENYSKALNGKKLEDYATLMADDYKKAFGSKDASALASSFAQDQEGSVQAARNIVQFGGLIVMVGGMAFCPPVAFGGGVISSFGGIAVEAYNENTKENPDEEKNKELKQEAFINAVLLAIGAGSGKVGSMTKAALTAKNTPKLVAAMADVGVDSSLSLLGDLTLTGQIDLSGEGFSQLMSLVAGHKGKLVEGFKKGKALLKEKLSAQANTNNKILQMPDGTVVEVRPDGSTVEVKADGEGTKAVKPEAKINNTEPKVINIPAGKFEAPNAKFAETDEAFRSIVTKRSNDIRELNKITDIDEFCQKSFELIKEEMGLEDSSIKLQIIDEDNYYDHETNTVFISRNWAGKEKGHVKGKGDKAEIFGGIAHELNHYLQWKEIVLNLDSENPNWNNLIVYLQKFEGANKNIEYIMKKYPDNTELKEAFEKAKAYQDNWLNYVDAFDKNGKLKTGTEYDKYRNQPVEVESFNRGDIVVDEYRKTVSKEIKTKVKPETTLKTKKELESALDKATTREDTDKPNMAVKNMVEVNVKSEAFKSEEELKNYLDNRKDLKAYEKSQIMELYKQDAEIVSISLKEIKKNYLGQDIPTFSFKDIDSLVKVAKINHNLVKDLINEKVIIYGEETPRFSRHDIVKLVEISKENPQLVSNLVYEKVKDSTGNEIPKFNAFEISNILDMYKQNPNIPDKLLARDQDGYYKLTAEQRDYIIRSSSQPFIQSEDFIDSITILNSKGIEIKDFTEISTKDKADALNVIAKCLEKIDINIFKDYIDKNALQDIVNTIKSSDDVQLIDRYLNKYQNSKNWDRAQVGSLLAFHGYVAKASPDKQIALKNILTNLLDKDIEASDIYNIMGTLSNKDFSKFDVNNYISQIKNTDDVDTIILLTATNDMRLINTLKQEKYNNFSIANKLLIAETVSEYNIPLYQVVNRFEYYNNLITPDYQNVIGGRRRRRNSNLKYMLGLPDASRLDIGSHGFTQNSHIIPEKSAKSSTAVQELADLVKDGVVGNHVLSYLPKEGELPPVIAKEIHRFYEAYLNHENFDDVLVPRVKSLNESLEYKSGEVFEVEGDPKIYIKGANNENIQLDIDKATYCKLFPPIERFSSTQNDIGNCWEVTGFNTIFRDPKERSRVLQCFHQKGDDVVVEFPNSNRQYSLAGMKNQAKMAYLSKGSLGFKLLEYADGKEIYRERMDMYIYNLTQKINDPSIDVAKRNELQKELDDFLNLSVDDKNKVYFDEDGNIIDKPEEMYDGGSTYARDGGFSFELFKRLGYKNANFEYFAGDNLDNLLTNPDNFKKYIMSIDIGGEGIEEEIDVAKGLYSNHAYMFTPNVDPNGKITDYNLLNPWGIVETKLTLEEIKKYGYLLEYAER